MFANRAFTPTSSTSWLTDTGATNHVTKDFSNLSLYSDYQHQDQVSVGKGQYFQSLTVRIFQGKYAQGLYPFHQLSSSFKSPQPDPASLPPSAFIGMKTSPNI